MWSTFRIQNRFGIVGLAAALAGVTGCSGEQPTTSIEPDTASAKRTVEDLKKDLKPPVIIKPSVPPATNAAPTAPNTEPR